MSTILSRRNTTASSSLPLVSATPDVSANRPSFTTTPCGSCSSIPAIGEVAPSFTCKAILNGRIQTTSLASLVDGGEWLVLAFVPAAWSFVCPTEIKAFNRRLQEFETRTAKVALISTDSEYTLRAWINTSEDEGGLGGLHMPFLSDRSHNISRSYGVLVPNEGAARRATFIIDPASRIRHVAVNDLHVGRSIDEIRRMIDALAFADEYGEGCPVDWQRGDKGLKMDGNEARKTRDTKGSRDWAPKLDLTPAQAAGKFKRPGVSRQSTWTNWLSKVPSPSTNGPSIVNQAAPADSPDTPKVEYHATRMDTSLSPSTAQAGWSQQVGTTVSEQTQEHNPGLIDRHDALNVASLQTNALSPIATLTPTTMPRLYEDARKTSQANSAASDTSLLTMTSDMFDPYRHETSSLANPREEQSVFSKMHSAPRTSYF